ncbi:hypothetical protein AB1Y20_016439 [Prymnesium parvum]|uniref:Uncharacterized protein n=1 Tax=Prymnesium parvum TaxID=97485 RepID=A0AB34IEH3_PRYPA
MLLQVETPAGVGPGDLFHIEHSGLLFEICVPDGVHEGQFIEVDLPLEEAQQDLLADTDAPPPELLEITVPPNAEGGAEILVEHGALQFYVTVPAGLVAGDLLTVEVPLATGHDLDEVPPLPSKAPADPTSAEAEDEVKPLRRRRRERKVSAGFESWASFPNGTTGKFDRLQEVEVYRTDGTWTPATVLTHYDASDTYDVQLRDGQINESDGLRHIKVGGFNKHQAVKVLDQKEWVWARVDDFYLDDSSMYGTYSAELLDGRKWYFLEASDLRQVQRHREPS